MVDDLSIVTLVYQGVIIFHILVPAKSSSRSSSPAKSCRESARHRPLYPSSFVLPAYLFRLCAWAVEMLWNADVSAADAIGIAQCMAVYVGKMVMNMIKHCWILNHRSSWTASCRNGMALFPGSHHFAAGTYLIGVAPLQLILKYSLKLHV